MAGYSVLVFSLQVLSKEDAESDRPVLTTPLFPVLLGWLHTLIHWQKGTQSTVNLVFFLSAPSFGSSFFLSPLLSGFFFLPLYTSCVQVPLAPSLLCEHHTMGQAGLFAGAPLGP